MGVTFRKTESVMESSPPDDELRIAPMEVSEKNPRLTEANQRLEAIASRDNEKPSPQRLAERQVTLYQLLGLMAYASVLLSPLSYLRVDIYAGFAGVAMLLFMGVMTWFNPYRLVFEYAFWLSVSIYLFALCLVFASHYFHFDKHSQQTYPYDDHAIQSRLSPAEARWAA